MNINRMQPIILTQKLKKKENKAHKMQTKDEGPLSEIVRRFHYAEFINNKNRKTRV